MGEIDMLNTVNEMIYYFTICWDNAAKNSKAKEMFQQFRLVLMELQKRLIAEEDDGK